MRLGKRKNDERTPQKSLQEAARKKDVVHESTDTSFGQALAGANSVGSVRHPAAARNSLLRNKAKHPLLVYLDNNELFSSAEEIIRGVFENLSGRHIGNLIRKSCGI